MKFHRVRPGRDDAQSGPSLRTMPQDVLDEA